MKEKIKKYFKEYIQDILLLIGFWMMTYELLLSPFRKEPMFPTLTVTNLIIKTIGLLFFVVAAGIAVRRYFAGKRNKQ